MQGKGLTVRVEVTEALYAQHLAGKKGLGIIPVTDEAMAFFGVIDIDKYNLSIAAIEQQCANLRLPVVPSRSKSGGVHLWCFSEAGVPADLMKSRLEEWSVALGFGGAEIFPKQSKLLSEKDTGNWINLPYFDHIRTERYGIYKGERLDLEQFIERCEKLRITEEQLQGINLPAEVDFLEGPPCLQSFAKSGFPEGMRNMGLFAVGVYLKKRFPDNWRAHLDDYNKKYMSPPLPSDEVSAQLKSLGRKEYNYACDKAPCKLQCNRQLCRTREFGVGQGQGDWGLVIESDVLKIMTEPPHWIVSVNGQRFELFSEDLITQRKFIEQCVNRLNYKPPMLPADQWDAEINKLLQAATEVEAPADSGAAGELLNHLEQFCTVYPQAETREELLVGKPWSEEGYTHFRAADFRRYLEAQHFRALNGPRLYAKLRGAGVLHKQFWVGNQNVQVWAVPQYRRAEIEVPARQTKGAM